MGKDIAGEESMFTKLIEVEKIHLNAADYEIRYYQNTNFNGISSFASEVEIGQNDKIILDDRSIGSLKHKVGLVLPAVLYSRRVSQSTVVRAHRHSQMR